MASLILFNDVLSPARLAADSSEAKSFKKPYGGTLVIGHNNPPTIINPILTDSSVSVCVATLIFDRLVQYDSHGLIEPGLAQSWVISPNKLKYTFNLKQGVKFHDGVELTAEDVLYTYEKIKDPKNRSPHFRSLGLVDQIKILDRYNICFILKKPSAFFLGALTREIVPKHLYEKENLRTGSFNLEPVGTGPFKFKKWKSNDEIVLEANSDYFYGRPYLDQVVYKVYPTDSEVWSALMRGEVDMAEFLDVENYELTKQDFSFKTYANATSDYYLIFYNLADPLLSDKKNRVAINYAIDRKNLIQNVEKGYGLEANGPFNQKSWAFDPQVKPSSYNPSKAIELLKENGWSDTDGDGVLDKNNSKFMLKMLVSKKDEKLKRMAMFIRQNLQEVGIEVQVFLYDDANEAKQMASTGKYQAILTFFLGPSVDPNETVKFWSPFDWRPGNVWSRTTDPKFDYLIRQGEITQNKDIRQKIYHHIHRIVEEEQYACFLYFPFDFHAVSKKIGGTEPFLGSLQMPDNAIKNFYIRDKFLNRKGGDD